MLLSMTGFGEGRSESDSIAVSVEVRSINNRHLKISYRSSEGYHGLEPKVEALIRGRIRRGSVQVNIRISRQSATAGYQLNTEVLANYRKQLETIDPEAASTPVGALLGLPGVVSAPEQPAADLEVDWPVIQAALEAALDALAKMRSHEGKALADDLQANCQTLAEELTGVEARSPLVTEDYRQRLQDRVGKSIEKLGVSIEASDLVREIALFVDRSDISEESVRLRSHLKQFDATIAEGENTGRKLEFIAQEMGRETNTIGSKANDTEISHRVVEMKAALERIREQVQNVE